MTTIYKRKNVVLYYDDFSYYISVYTIEFCHKFWCYYNQKVFFTQKNI